MFNFNSCKAIEFTVNRGTACLPVRDKVDLALFHCHHIACCVVMNEAMNGIVKFDVS